MRNHYLGDFSLDFKRSVKKDTKKLPQSVLQLIQKKIIELKDNPFPPGSIQLSGYQGFYRIRISNYRVLYLVNQKKKMITIYQIRHRKKAYRNL